MRYRWFGIVLGLLIVAGIGLPQPTAAAEVSPIQIAAQPFFDGNYRSGSWLPFRVTVANTGADVTALISLQIGATFETSVELPRGAKKNVVLYAQPTGTFRRSATVRALVDGKEAAKVDVALANGFASSMQVVGTISPQPPTVPRPGANQQPRSTEMLPIAAADLPDRREGLTLFDALVIDGAPLNDLSPAQQQALVDWLQTGGQLIIGGDQMATTLRQLPEPLRIVTVGDAAPAQPISLLSELSDEATLPATALKGGTDTRTIATAGTAAVGVQRDVGRGQVTILGFSLSDPRLAKLPPTTNLWTQIATLRPATPVMMGMQPPPEAQAQQLGFALMQLPVLAMPPMGVLIGLLALYLLIVGPGLYLLLRRLDRQAWGWIAIPAITLLFSLGAYGYGLRLRGNDIILNQISVIEPVGGRARVRTYAGLFSPRTQTYRVTSPSDALFKPMPAGEGGPINATTTNGRFMQGSGVREMNVAQWSMSTFAAEQMIAQAPLAAQLTLNNNVLQGAVRNTGPTVVRNVTLFQNMRSVNIGDLQPGAGKDVNLNLANNAPADLGGSLSMLLLKDRWDFSKPAQPPTDIRMQMMILDALYSSPFDRPTAPTIFGWLDQAPIPLGLPEGRVHAQQLALVTAPVNVAFAPSGTITLPRGWLTPRIETNSPNGGPCMTQFGSGWFADSSVIINTFQLPAGLQPFTLTKATIRIQADGVLPAAMKWSVYDWDQQAWIDQRAEQTSLALDQPARFVSATGIVRVKLDTQNPAEPNGKGGGCVSTDLTVEGTRP